MGRKSSFSAAQRRDAVLALLRREEPGAKLARRLGISEPTLYRWRDEFLAGGEAALAGQAKNGSTQQVAELERQIEERDRVIGELTIANRFLKKVSGASN